MSVRKRKWTTSKGEMKEAWIVAYSQDGKRHIETFKRRKDADAKAQQVGVDIRAGTHTPVSRSITVKEAADDWIKTAEVEGREALTIVQYRTHANHIDRRIGTRKLANLTAAHVNGFRDDLLATMSRALARKVLTSLKSLLKDAQRRGNVAQNVALAVKRIEPDKRGKRLLKIGEDIPSTDEIRVLIAALPDRWRPLFYTAIFAGLRSSELRGLRWEDVDLQAKQLHVRQRADRLNVIGSPKSEAGHRTVPLGPAVVNVLREWKVRCPPGEPGLAFPSPSGRLCRHHSIVRALQKAVEVAPCVRRTVQDDGWRKLGSRALSRDGGGSDGHTVRTNAGHFRQPAGVDRVHQGRQAARFGGDYRQPLRGAAGPSDRW
jgi:integrase